MTVPMPNPIETDTMYVSQAADWIADLMGMPLDDVLDTLNAEVRYMQQSERSVTEHVVNRLAAATTPEARREIMDETGSYQL